MSLPTTSPEESGALRWGQRSVSTAAVPSSPRCRSSAPAALRRVRLKSRLCTTDCEGMGPCVLSLVIRAAIITLSPRRRGERSLPLHRHHAAFLDCEREPSLLERERLVTEQLAPPAGERRHIGLVVGGDAVEVIDGGDHLSGDAVPFRRHPQ